MSGFSRGYSICVCISICYRSLDFDLISKVLLMMLIEMKWEGNERLRDTEAAVGNLDAGWKGLM